MRICTGKMILSISFFIADTGQNHLDGKVGMISSYDTVNCRYVAKVSTTNQWTASGSTEMLLSPENIEPYTWVRTATHVPCPSAETCTITLANHFAAPVSASPFVTFQSSVFSDVGGITGSPHTGGQAQQDRLIELIERKEAIAKEEAKKNTSTTSGVGKRLVEVIFHACSCAV